MTIGYSSLPGECRNMALSWVRGANLGGILLLVDRDLRCCPCKATERLLTSTERLGLA